MAVDHRIIDLLKDCKTYHELTHGMVNPAMGSVLQLWHVARNDGINDPAHAYLPKQEKLEAAAGLRARSACARAWESTVHRRLGEAARQANSDSPTVTIVCLVLTLSKLLYSWLSHRAQRGIQ